MNFSKKKKKKAFIPGECKNDQLTTCPVTLGDWLPEAEQTDVLFPGRLLVDETLPSRSESWKRQTSIRGSKPSWKVKHVRLHLHEGERPVNIRHQILEVLPPQDRVFRQSRGQAENHRRSQSKCLSGNTMTVKLNMAGGLSILSILNYKFESLK